MFTELRPVRDDAHTNTRTDDVTSAEAESGKGDSEGSESGAKQTTAHQSDNLEQYLID